MCFSSMLVAGCMQDQATVQVEPLTVAAVSGKTVTAGNTSIYVNPNGTLSGSGPAGAIAGTWEIKNGQWCRAITAPRAWVNTQCQNAKLNGNILTLPNAVGTTVVNWTITETS